MFIVSAVAIFSRSSMGSMMSALLFDTAAFTLYLASIANIVFTAFFMDIPELLSVSSSALPDSFMGPAPTPYTVCLPASS